LAGFRFVANALAKEAFMLLDEVETIRSQGVSALLVDQTTLAGGSIADYLGIPFVTICNALPMNFESSIPPIFTGWSYRPIWWAQWVNWLLYQATRFSMLPLWMAIQSYRKRWGLSPYASLEDLYSPLAQLSQIPKALDFPRHRLPASFHYVGPFQTPNHVEPCSVSDPTFSFESLGEQPIVYANLGTIQSRNIRTFKQVAAAFHDGSFDAQLVISMGNPLARPDSVSFAGSPQVFAFPPHQLLINRATLVITHAGSSALQCLAAGVPMVAIPITTDQPGMAARLARAKVAEVIPVSQLTPPLLTRAISRVLHDPTYRANAQRLSTAIKAAGGVKRAADIITDVVR
jgi:MGT family glycosyltransferase